MSTEPKKQKTVKPLTLGACPGVLLKGADAILSPHRAKELGFWGCVYRITFVTGEATGSLTPRTYIYTGSKGFGPLGATAAAKAWETYTSSSDDVNAKLLMGVYKVTWEILAYGKTKAQCLAVEASYITQSVKQYGTSRVLNRAQVGGGKLTSYRGKYNKQKKTTKAGFRET